MKVCEVPFYYDISLVEARRFTEDEKKDFAEWFHEIGFVPTSNHIDLKYITLWDVDRVLGGRKSDGSFCGCDNNAFIISDEEWDELIALNEKKRVEQKRKEIEKDIAFYTQEIAACKRQGKLYTPEEARRERKRFNDINNEGGDGFVPVFYTHEQYEYYTEKLVDLKKQLLEYSE